MPCQGRREALPSTLSKGGGTFHPELKIKIAFSGLSLYPGPVCPPPPRPPTFGPISPLIDDLPTPLLFFCDKKVSMHQIIP